MRPVDSNFQPGIRYFQYEIGPYRTDYLLHFRREPHWELYKNEIFNKLDEFTGYDLARYLNFHYDPYEGKAEFLRFLRYETSERIRYLRKRTTSWRIKLEMVLAWVEEQERLLDRAVVDTTPVAISAGHPDKVQPNAEESDLKEMSPSQIGRIEVSEERNLDRVIQLLLLLKDVTAPGQPLWPVFRRFKQNDIAAIMAQFEAFNGKQRNTIEKRIIQCRQNLPLTDPKTVRLNKALAEFFY
jgi:hypothetical protein